MQGCPEGGDLTFHEPRHEEGSRLLEAGWLLHNVARMLGQVNISQTSTSLNAANVGLQEATAAARRIPLHAKPGEHVPRLQQDGAEAAQRLIN